MIKFTLMADILYDTEKVCLSYHKENKLIEMVWRQNASSEEYRAIFQKMIDHSAKNPIRFAVSDLRKEGLVNLEDVKWMNQNVLQKAAEYELEKIALVTNDTIFANVYTDVVKNKLKNSPVQVQTFTSIGEAKSWLLNE